MRSLGEALPTLTRGAEAPFEVLPIVSREFKMWLRGRDLNPRPLGYEPNELPDCSTPRQSQTSQPNTIQPKTLKSDLNLRSEI